MDVIAVPWLCTQEQLAVSVPVHSVETVTVSVANSHWLCTQNKVTTNQCSGVRGYASGINSKSVFRSALSALGEEVSEEMFLANSIQESVAPSV